MTTTNNAVKATVTPIDFNGRALQPIDDIFGPDYSCKGLNNIFVRNNRHPKCIASNPMYIPDMRVLNRLMMWWNHSYAVKTLMPFGLYGETGTGKTEMFLYLCDKLNEPVVIESMTECKTVDQLEGSLKLTVKDGCSVTEHEYSKLAQAYKFGWTVIIDEIDKVSPQVGAALHLILERKPWAMSVFNETITCHKNFRLVATANTLGDGGSDRYISSVRQDSALRARIGWMQVDFLESQHELEILQLTASSIPRKLRARMVETANDFRNALLGKDRKGKVSDPLNCVFSTRTLVNWADNVMCFGKDATFWDGFTHAFMGSVDSEDFDKVEIVYQMKWGHDHKEKLVGQLNQEADDEDRAKKKSMGK
jgi:cobaltochelatase CobS